MSSKWFFLSGPPSPKCSSFFPCVKHAPPIYAILSSLLSLRFS
jgi:hypothetical protein